MLSIRVHFFFPAHCTYVDILKCCHCSNLSKFVGYTLILTIGRKLSTIYSIGGKIDIPTTAYLIFDEVSLKVV